MIELDSYLSCDHKGCKAKTTARMRFNGFVGAYCSGATLICPRLSEPRLYTGWIVKEVRTDKNYDTGAAIVVSSTAADWEVKAWCPRHAKAHELEGRPL